MTETCSCGASITLGSAEPYALVDQFRERHAGCVNAKRMLEALRQVEDESRGTHAAWHAHDALSRCNQIAVAALSDQRATRDQPGKRR